MELYFFRKINEPHIEEFREIALHHNARTSRVLAAVVGLISLVLYILDMRTNTEQVLHYPNEYSQAITFILLASATCFAALMVNKQMGAERSKAIAKYLGNFYALIVVAASLWITFVMQHNPSNTMSVFVLGMLTVAALWIFEEKYAIAIALTVLVLFSIGLRYFQTDPCKLFANYIMAGCATIFFLCISRITFSINYNHFKQLKRIAQDKEDMTKVNAMQTEILTIVAHDLHAPINNVITLVDMLKKPDLTCEEREEYYDMILTTCRRSDGIIDDLLSVAKQDEKVPGFTTTLLNDFVTTTVNNFIVAKGGSTNIVFRAPEKPIYASVNQAKMTRVFDNLLTNAVKFTTDNGIVNIALAKENGMIKISVRDNGIGIPADMLPQLFTRFSKAGRQGLRGQKSYGLGLSSCKMIMTMHHGDISAESSEGRGTTMILTLPTFDPSIGDVWDTDLLS